MGCDGGTIPKRDELVKVKKKPEVKDKTAELSFQWRCCDISQEVLQSPIVTCGLGRLYNKSSVIEGLLNRSLLPESAKHIKNLKDVKDLNLTPNPEYKPDAEKAEGMIDIRAAPYICPVTGLEMSGKFRFVSLWNCGCVMSERAIKEIDSKTCHKCQKIYFSNDIIVLNGNETDIEIMKKNMADRLALQKAQKKSKKLLKTEIKSETVVKEEIGNSSTSSASNSVLPSNSTLPSSSTSTSSQNILGNKRTAGADKDLMVDEEIKKIKNDYSVAKDPKVTSVYKSLFTSHKSEQQQNRAHWVTYNPFYN